MIIQKLLSLESEAQEAMRTLEKEQAHLARQTDNQLAQRIAEIEGEKDTVISSMAQEVLQETQNAIAQIQAKYKQQGSELTDAFTANQSIWAEKVATHVLFGGA